MLSRRTALALGQVYRNLFYREVAYGEWGADQEALLKFYAHDYDPAFYDQVQHLKRPEHIELWIMLMQTGQSLARMLPGFTTEQLMNRGQEYLRKLAEDCLRCVNGDARFADEFLENRQFTETVGKDAIALLRSLKFDGYYFKDGHLLAPESDVFDTREVADVLETLYAELRLARKDVAVHHLKLSEEHWQSGKWDDCIGNARKFLECVLQEIAASHSFQYKNAELPKQIRESPGKVRDYLEKEGLLDTKEKQVLREDYGFFSEKGGHPYCRFQWATFVSLIIDSKGLMETCA